MSKFFLLTVIISAGFSSSAQTRFNFFIGPQAVTARYHAGNAKQSTSFKSGFQLGAGAKVEFENRLYFAPEVYYSYKGYKVLLHKSASPPDLSAINNNTSIHTLETALLIQYDFNNKPSHPFFKIGPSIDFQLAGKEKFDRVDGSRISRPMKYGFTDYGRYAMAAVVHLGYETSDNFIFYIHYAQGLTNLSNADVGPSIQYRVIGVSIGKYFR